MKKLLVAMIVALFVSGCITPSYKSLNIQRSVGRGAGDNAVTISLDTIEDLEQAEKVRARTEEITENIVKFLEKGSVALLPLGELKSQLNKIVPDEYEFLVEIALSQTQGLTVPIDVVGENNIKRIKSVCDGILTACKEYELRDRPTMETLSKTLVNPEVIEKYGMTMKKEYQERK